jgi:hypothetical protein
LPAAIPVNAAMCLIGIARRGPLAPALSWDLAPEELIRADLER